MRKALRSQGEQAAATGHVNRVTATTATALVLSTLRICLCCLISTAQVGNRDLDLTVCNPPLRVALLNTLYCCVANHMLLQESPIEPTHTAAGATRRSDVRPAQILTVNVEEYFQAGVFHRFIDARNWYRFDSRLQQNIEDTLTVLDEHGATATFFVLGWIAEKYPQLIRRISAAGHEVASRGYLHQPLLKRDRRERLDDLLRSRQILEDVVGRQVAGFRLSDGWLRSADLAFLEDVREAGYLYDSSLLPRRRDFRNDSSRRGVHEYSLPGGRLLEIPPSTIPVAGSWLPIAGGNYQRQLPNALMRSAVTRWIQTESSPFVMYFQVWEMDSEQPELSAVGKLTRIRHYRNLGKYRWLLPEYLRTWRFVSVRDHVRQPHSPLQSLSQQLAATATPTAAMRLWQPPVTTAVQAAEPAAAERSAATTARDARGVEVSRAAVAEPTPVTLVIPCYNEESSLPYLARTLEHLQQTLRERYALQVMFVDDCSRDQTPELLQRLFGAEPHMRIVQHARNRGVSAAIRTGLQAATTEIVCSMDCDCSYDPQELQHMLPLLQPGVAMVSASPYHRDGGVRNVPGWRLLLSHSLSVLYRVLLRQSLRTWTSCFRVYRRSQILDLPLQEDGFLGTAELAAQLCLRRRTVAEHPAVLEVRLFGASKMKTLRTIGSHLRLLSRIAAQRCCGRTPATAVPVASASATGAEPPAQSSGLDSC